MTGLLDMPRRADLGEGWTGRLLSVREEMEAWQEGEALARGERDRALCSNACLLARALLRGGEPAFKNGEAVLEAMTAEQIGRLAKAWRDFDRERDPAPWDERAVDAAKESLEHAPYERLQWRVLKAFGALPTEARVREMTHRDYLWCALNLVLDGEEELARLCPACRAEAEQARCPICGARVEDCGENGGFDMERFRAMGGDGA